MQQATLQDGQAQTNTNLVDAVGAVAVLFATLVVVSHPLAVAGLVVGAVGAYVGARVRQRTSTPTVSRRATSDSVARNTP